MPELRYHHIGIPTSKELPKGDYFPEHKMYASGYLESPYGVEWLKFDPDCSLPELVKTVPHVAFIVRDIKEAVKGKEVIIKPNSPSPGVTVAFIVDNDAPVEFLQFDGPEDEVWPKGGGFKTAEFERKRSVRPKSRRVSARKKG